MSLSDLMVFDDEEPNISSSSEPKQKRKRKSKDVVEEVKLPIVEFDDNKDTEEYIQRYFKDREKIGKDSQYVDRKSFLKNKITATDKILEIAVINASAGISVKFISISFKIITEKEIKELSKHYVHIDDGGRYPTLVEKKYMYNDEHIELKRKIMDQFM